MGVSSVSKLHLVPSGTNQRENLSRRIGTVKYQLRHAPSFGAPFPMNQVPASPAPAADHRQRLLEGMAEVLVTRPYAEITIADIVAQARVSKRTFYEQFASKEACLLALGERLSDQTLAIIMANYKFDADWVEQLRSVTQAYLSGLEAQPALVRAVYIELLTIGPQGLAMRRRMVQRFAEFLIMQVEVFRALEPRKRPLTPEMAMAVVGGINELILHAIEQGQADRLSALTPTVTDFVQAVISSLDPLANSPPSDTAQP
jgi:AcrR family transcriptional regulator